MEAEFAYASLFVAGFIFGQVTGSWHRMHSLEKVFIVVIVSAVFGIGVLFSVSTLPGS